VLWADTRNEVNADLVKSVNSIMPLTKILQFIFVILQVRIIGGNRQQREKKRAKNREKV
jgi:hypothetical protein